MSYCTYMSDSEGICPQGMSGELMSRGFDREPTP